jgi:hypothetical protein
MGAAFAAWPDTQGRRRRAGFRRVQQWALVVGGPAKDVRHYEDAGYVTPRYLEVLEPRAHTVLQFLNVDRILSFLQREESDEPNAKRVQWTGSQNTDAIETARRIINHPRWPEIAKEGLESADGLEFDGAAAVADKLGIDTWDARWSSLQAKPLDGHLWYMVISRATPQTIDEVVAFAEKAIELDGIATGPTEMMAAGKGYEAHGCLDMIVQHLERFPGKGWPLIEASLKSPVIRNRNMAARALAGWCRENWAPHMEHALREARKAEPVDSVREYMDRVLTGEGRHVDRAATSRDDRS